MEYLKVSQAAEKWGLSARRVRVLCAEGKIDGVIRKGNLYMIPANVAKPEDGRRSKAYLANDIATKAIQAQSHIQVNTALTGVSQSINDLNSAKSVAMSSEIQNLAVTMQTVSSKLVSALQSDTMQNILNVGQKIANLAASIDFKPILKGFSEAMLPITYINLLGRLGWPVFLIDDDGFRQEILDACKDNEDPNVVAEIIYKYCTDDFFLSMEKDWKACPIINEKRFDIFSEAFMMHQKGYYYASTSILMNQLYGVSSDIEKALADNGLFLNKDEKEGDAELFGLNPKRTNTEKSRLFQNLMFTESGILLWDAMADYLKNICLFSGSDYSTINNHPLRNKICHGNQLEFGTKEHSLKAIFVIDMLIQLAYEIDRIISVRKEDDN